MNYLPTGTCFDDAPEIIMSGYFPRERMNEIRIVHALVSRKDTDGETYAHCWVEYDGAMYEIVIDSADGERVIMVYTPDDHASIFTTHDRTEYALQELAIAGMLCPLKSTGPYKLEYLKRCKDWEEVKHLYA